MVSVHKRPFAPPTQRSGLAIAAMILGFLGAIFAGLTLVTLGWLAIASLAVIPGLICGFMALRRANANPVAYGGRGFAVAGILAACAAILLAVVALAIIFYPPTIAMVHTVAGGLSGSSGGGTGGHVEDETHDPASLTAPAPTVGGNGTGGAPERVPPPPPEVLAAGGAGAAQPRVTVPPAPPAEAAAPVVPAGPQITTLEGAMAALASGDGEQRKGALRFLATVPVVESRHVEVVSVVERSLSDKALRTPAFAAYKHWATKEDVPELRRFLEEWVRTDRGLEGGTEREGAIELLARFGDEASAPLMVESLHNFFTRGTASKGLVTLGPGVQEAVIPILSDADKSAAAEGVTILAKIGTERSVPALQKVVDGGDAEMAKGAGTAIEAIRGRARGAK